MKYYPLQERFTGGEMSPRLYGQANTDRYQNSLEEMTNFLALPQGPAMRRQGFGYVDTAFNSTDVRLLPFKIPGSTDYCVELGPSYIAILSRNGREYFTIDQLLVNGNFKSGLLAWVSTSAAGLYLTTERDTKRALSKVTSGNKSTGQETEIVQEIDTTAISGVLDFSFDWGAYFNDGTIGDAWFEDSRVRVKVGTTSGGGELYNETFDPNLSETTTSSDTTKTPYVLPMGTGTVATTVDIGVNNTIFVTAEVYVGSVDGGAKEKWLGSTFGYVGNISIAVESTTTQSLFTPWPTEADLALIQYVSESGGGRMYFTHPNYPPQLLTYDDGSWTFGALTLAGEPADWTGTNYPSAVEFYQGRLWLAATPDDPSTVWASKAGDPFDFTVGVDDDDAMELPLSTTGGIKWMKGQKGLVIGTDIEEQIITSQGSLITPSDRKATQQSSWGSVDIQPTMAGNDIVYVSQDRTKVRAINSTFANASWSSVDLTWVAEHITQGRVIELAYAQSPNYQLWCLLNDGSIVICTYDREHETVAWQRVVTEGSFLSVTKTDSVEGTNMWAAVRRGELITLEAIDADESQWQWADSWISRPVVAFLEGWWITGLEHLEGLTVQIIIDGAVQPEQVVQAGGFVIVQLPGTAIVGLGYNAKMVTLPLSQGNKGGTGLVGKQRYSRVVAQLYDSALPLINGVRPPERSPSTPMGTVEPNVTMAADTRNLGWDDGGRVTIEQDLPKKTMVTAIYGKAEQGTT